MYCLLLRANTRHITPRAPRSRCLGSADKKRPLGSHPQRSGVLFPVTSSECSRRSALRSGRTVRGGSDDRSWFGRPQAIKKGGRECRQQQGDDASKSLGLPAAPPSSGSQECRGCRLHTAKKGAVPPAPSSTHCPFTEEATEGLRGIHLLVVAVTTKRLLESATQEKAEVPPSACVRRIGPPYEGLN